MRKALLATASLLAVAAADQAWNPALIDTIPPSVHTDSKALRVYVRGSGLSGSIYCRVSDTTPITLVDNKIGSMFVAVGDDIGNTMIFKDCSIIGERE
jgi:hypothetical protein